MNIDFQLTRDDLFALQKYVIEHSLTHHVKRKYFKWAFTLILGLSLLLFVNTSVITFILSLFVAIGIFFIAPIIYNKLSFIRFRKHIEANDYSHVLGSCHMSFSEDGITRTINNEETLFTWQRFEKWEEDTTHYFLFENDLQALIIPKQSDQISEKDEQQYQQWIKTSIIKD